MYISKPTASENELSCHEGAGRSPQAVEIQYWAQGSAMPPPNVGYQVLSATRFQHASLVDSAAPF